MSTRGTQSSARWWAKNILVPLLGTGGLATLVLTHCWQERQERASAASSSSTPFPTAGVTPTPNPKATPERPTIHKEFYVLTGIQRPLSSKLDYNRGSDGDQENIVLTHFVEEQFDKFIADAEEGLGITITYQDLPPLSNNTVSVATITGANVTEFISNIQTKLKTGNILYSVKRTTKMTYRLSPK